MPYVTVHVDASETLEEMSDEALREEMERREKKAMAGCEPETEAWLLQQIYEHFRSGGAPRCLREYIWRKLGRVL